jgi:hypothetical protein
MKFGDTSSHLGAQPGYTPPTLRPFDGNVRRGQPILSKTGVAYPVSTIPPLRGYVRFITTEGPLLSLDMMTSGEPYMLPDGFASGWDSVQRINRLALPKWTGGVGLRQAVPVTMDVLGWRALDVQDAWDALQRMAAPAGGTRPPALQIAGPVDHPDVRWVITGFEPDAATTKRRGSKLVRQNVLITLSQWIDIKAERLVRSKTPAKDKPRQVVTTAAINTMHKLAKQYLGSSRRWQEIAKLNKGLHDPDRHIHPNTKIAMPPR